MRRALMGLAALLLAATPSAWAQAAPSPPPSLAPTPAPNLEYRVGAGDVLDIVVFGNDDLTRTTTIQPNGMIALPLLGEVLVADLSVPEIKNKLTTLLARDFLVHPQVDVKIREYQSQFVIVVGEVNNPGRKPLRGRTRLIDLLVEAGGFQPGASGEIVITRADGAFDGGSRTLKLRLGSSSLTPQDQVNLEIPLKNGDIVTASPKYYVTVEGEVNRPGRYVLEGELTVTGVISSAGGLTRFGKSGVQVRRTELETGDVKIIKVDLNAVRKGKQRDVPLLANDVVSVLRRTF